MNLISSDDMSYVHVDSNEMKVSVIEMVNKWQLAIDDDRWYTAIVLKYDRYSQW